jgi:hypothetical protein
MRNESPDRDELTSPEILLPRGNFWLTLAFAFCILFGFALILNVHPVGDGLWFWYARLLRGGQRLYSGMHVPLQPLFVLITAWMQELLGPSWLASKSLAALQVVAYSATLLLIVRYFVWKDPDRTSSPGGIDRAVVLLAAFGTTISSIYYRFDDYHVTGNILVTLSIYLLLRLRSEPRTQRILALAGILGVLSGIAVSNRINDGAALGLGVAILLPLFATRKKFPATLVFVVAALLALRLVIALTGDSVHDWAMETIIRAAAIKGGSGQALTAPITFPIAIAREIKHDPTLIRSLLFALAAVAIFAVVLPRLARRFSRPRLLWLSAAVVSLAFVPYFWRTMVEGFPVRAVAELFIILCYPLFLLAAWRCLRAFFLTPPPGWQIGELLVVIPFGQLLSGAMTSSGHSVLEGFPPVALMLLVLPLSSLLPIRESGWQKSLYLGFCTFLIATSFPLKVVTPYTWSHFEDGTMFVDRQWYRHPDFGPMYIERPQLRFMVSMCDEIHQSAHPSLLAMPFPYPNYFCNIPPWRGYVQTWYDTTSKSRIDALIQDLQQPPDWIVYQRAIDTIQGNEHYFSHGRPLPHRALDRLITDRIRSRSWSVVQDQCFEGAQWLLLRTQPTTLTPPPMPPNLCKPEFIDSEPADLSPPSAPDPVPASKP